MDGVIAEKGNVDRDQTEVYIPNEHVVEAIAGYDNQLFGASVNPNRSDALARLEQAKADAVVLIKWIPCILGIDLGAPAMVPFYRKLIETEAVVRSRT